MKKITPMQRMKFHKDNLFNIFIESLIVSYQEEAHLHKEYDKDDYYYKTVSFNKSSPNYLWNMTGVESDHVIRIESYLKKSFATLGLSFTNKNQKDYVTLMVQQQVLNRDINDTAPKHPKIQCFAERYSTMPLSIEEMMEKIKLFNKNYMTKLSHQSPNHQTFISALIKELNMEFSPLDNPKTGINKHISSKDSTVFSYIKNKI